MNYFYHSPWMGAWPVLGPGFAILLILIVAWSLIWKGLALWYAARNHQTAWYVILLIVNTLGILEIIYILFFRKDNNDNTTKTIVHTTTTTTSTPTNPTAPPPSSTPGSSSASS